jgi:uncharacterized membrane protein
VRHHPYRAFSPLLALVLGACAADSPSAPTPPTPAAAPAPVLAVQGARLDELRSALTDARTRLIPALGGATNPARLEAALDAADLAIRGDDARALAASLARARGAAAAVREQMPADDAAVPELDALLLMLDGLSDAVPQSLTAVATTPAAQ